MAEIFRDWSFQHYQQIMKKWRKSEVSVPWMIWHGITQNRHLPDINLPDPCETWCHFCGFDVCTGLPKKALNTSLINHKWFNVNHFVDKLIIIAGSN